MSASIRFRDGVSCRRDAGGGNALTLIGRTVDRPDELAYVTFAVPGPEGLPDFLEEPVVERVDEQHHRIVADGRQWKLAAASVHVHRETTGVFYKTIRPRPAPLRKRLFWRMVLGLAARPRGRRLLLALRRR